MRGETIIIQGDSFQTSLILDDINSSLIKKIVFVCNSLSLQKELFYSESTNEWILSFSCDETAKLKEGVHSFDITIVFIDNQVLTSPGFYKARLRILKKENKINYDNG